MRNRITRTQKTDAFDHWIRDRFKALNTELETLYFANSNRASVRGVGDSLKHCLLAEGKVFIVDLLNEGNTDEGFESGFDLLGNLGLYMGACRRHEVTDPSRETRSSLVEASALALQLGASLGVTPRFATSHLATHNRALDGIFKSFTSLEAESLFIEYNSCGIFAYQRAAQALSMILPIGISHPVAYELLIAAEQALQDVARYNKILFDELDSDRFFYCVRPYYKPYRVGLHEYRGANAGDFSGINEIDLMLGLCQAENSSYSQLLVDKFLFMLPEDQVKLRNCMRQQSILDSLLEQIDQLTGNSCLRKNTEAFLRVVAAHGYAAIQHHDQLVSKYIEQPAQQTPAENLADITASGPPLPVVLRGLQKLRDLRAAVDRDDIPSRYHDIERLKQKLHG